LCSHFVSFIVIFRARDYNKVEDDRDQETTSNRVTDRTQIHRILAEVGLNPSDYIFSPLPEENPSREPTPNQPSAFSTYPSEQTRGSQQSLKLQSQSLFTSGRPLSYVQQPPPPPPPSQPSTTQPPPPSNSNPPPPSSQAPIKQQQGPPPPSQPGPLFFLNQPASNTQKTTSQSPPDMNQHSFSPRRSPPPPPTHITSNPQESSLSAEHYLRQINSHHNPPVKVVKPSTQNVVYKKEIRIRYLQPPTPPPPAPIIIREKHIPPNPPETVSINLFLSIHSFVFYSQPLLIRERKPEARTPPPLTIRERPPSPPAPLE
jgi:hypothetical protein